MVCTDGLSSRLASFSAPHSSARPCPFVVDFPPLNPARSDQPRAGAAPAIGPRTRAGAAPAIGPRTRSTSGWSTCLGGTALGAMLHHSCLRAMLHYCSVSRPQPSPDGWPLQCDPATGLWPSPHSPSSSRPSPKSGLSQSTSSPSLQTLYPRESGCAQKPLDTRDCNALLHRGSAGELKRRGRRWLILIWVGAGRHRRRNLEQLLGLVRCRVLEHDDTGSAARRDRHVTRVWQE